MPIVAKPRKKAPAAARAGAAPKIRAPRRRLPPAERRSQIIEAAKELFGEGGFERISMRKIAGRVGISQAAIYQHFEDKEAILFAIAEGFFAQLIAAIEKKAEDEGDPVSRFARSIRGYIEVGLSRPEEYRLVFMTNAPGFKKHGAHREVPGAAVKPQIQPHKGAVAFGYLQDSVRELIASGHIRAADPDLLSEALWASMHGIVSLLITHVDFPWEKEKLIELQTAIILNGILPEASPARAAPQRKAPKA